MQRRNFFKRCIAGLAAMCGVAAAKPARGQFIGPTKVFNGPMTFTIGEWDAIHTISSSPPLSIAPKVGEPFEGASVDAILPTWLDTSTNPPTWYCCVGKCDGQKLWRKAKNQWPS